MITAAEVEDGTVVRMPKAYPVYDHGYQDNLATIRQYLATLTNLQTIGRNGLHRYNNQDHSMLTGVYAARNVMGEQYDVWSVNTEQEYHEEVRTTPVVTADRLAPTRARQEASQGPSPEEIISAVFAEIDPVALGIAVGTVSALCLFAMSAILLLKGGQVVGPNLSLLGQYLTGFTVTWTGACIGFIEAGVGGFFLGYCGAWLRNRGMNAYATLLQRRAIAEAHRDVLDKV